MMASIKLFKCALPSFIELLNIFFNSSYTKIINENSNLYSFCRNYLMLKISKSRKNTFFQVMTVWLKLWKIVMLHYGVMLHNGVVEITSLMLDD